LRNDLAQLGAGPGNCLTRLRDHHRDPFDRILVAQAICEPLRLITGDPRLCAYSDLVMLV
jgi:PIN domain nuclease of toxin-antitoxin system